MMAFTPGRASPPTVREGVFVPMCQFCGGEAVPAFEHVMQRRECGCGRLVMDAVAFGVYDDPDFPFVPGHPNPCPCPEDKREEFVREEIRKAVDWKKVLDVMSS